MQITVFGFVWIAVLVITFFRPNITHLVALTLLSMVFQSASVIIWAERGVGPQLMTSLAMIMQTVLRSSVFREGKLRFQTGNRIKEISYIGIIIMAAAILISRLSNINAYAEGTVTFMVNCIPITIYLLCFISLWSISYKINMDELHTILIRIMLFVVMIGFLQFLTTTNIFPRNILWNTLIYTEDTDSAYYWFAYFPRLFSSFMEPSYCGSFLVGSFYYIISYAEKSRFQMGLSLGLVLAIILTFSSTAYGGLAIMAVIYLILSKDKKALTYLVPVALTSILLLSAMGYLMPILNQVIFNKEKTGSYAARSNWDRISLSHFVSFPWLGYGYKNTRGSQFLLSILSQVGIIGSIGWFFISLPMLWQEWKHRRNNIMMPGGFLLISVMVTMFIGIPDMDFIVLWFALYINALIVGNHSYCNSIIRLEA